jgi:hypothetical protein
MNSYFLLSRAFPPRSTVIQNRMSSSWSLSGDSRTQTLIVIYYAVLPAFSTIQGFFIMYTPQRVLEEGFLKVAG